MSEIIDTIKLVWTNKTYRIYGGEKGTTLSKWYDSKGRDRNVPLYRALNPTDTRIPKSVRDAYHKHNEVIGDD